ncbi:MAG TPA: alkaline phosphatase family protein [Bacteroidetes bacterium]|nr:alkaline phosphatase family protein [Chitinophagales bacterium]HAE13822.1 alkaline phosphatase family protein [Bacteroidota bacterium]HQU40205.1 alkaline phosphatase family protein [Chitinophagales bacterium]
MKNFILFVLAWSMLLSVHAQTESKNPNPKLIVGVVVDQMSYDLLYRFWNNYSEGGFRRLVKNGYSCENTHYNYVPTYTGPGHASIYTGSVPAVHGIVGNNWFDPVHNNEWYCTKDTLVSGVGTITAAGQMSPAPLLTTTITDQLKVASNGRAKVVGVAMKDRGAILPAGHAADAAYWFDGYTNAFVSSTWYMETLPAWVEQFNKQQWANQYMATDWDLFLPKNSYTNSTADNVPWETLREGETAPVFPHMTSNASSMELIKGTPYGNSLTVDFAKAALLGEGLGKDQQTDFLCVSFSSTDYVGHAYGPYSMETEDTYIRLDRDLAAFLQFLDTEVGSGNYLFFLTADHGVAPTPGYMQSLEIPAGVFSELSMITQMDSVLDAAIGTADWILSFENQQVYLNPDAVEQNQTYTGHVADVLRNWAFTSANGVAHVLEVDALGYSNIPSQYKEMYINGIYPKRCGDILFVFEPNWFGYSNTGSSHGSQYAYDTQVPLLWYGWKVRNGKSWTRHAITDIAPTIAAMLRIPQPSGCIGQVIEEMK